MMMMKKLELVTFSQLPDRLQIEGWLTVMSGFRRDGMKSALLWDIRQCRVVIVHRRFERRIGLQASRVPKRR
jgi:hypothetical protein